MFLNQYIKQLDPALEMSEEAFAQIFKLLDHDGDHQISQQELTNYIKIFTK
jgi:Ca2+-binding EF-hand superfamily protein